MSLQRTLVLATRIVRQFASDRRTMALLFLAPVLVMTVLQFVLNSSAAGATLDVAGSGDAASQAVAARVQAQLNGQHGLTVRFVQSGDITADLKSGAADGGLVFPANFAEQAASGTITLPLQVEGTNPGVVAELQNIVALAGSAIAPGGPTQSAALHVTLATTYLYGGPQFTQTDAIAPLLIGLFSFFFVFLLTSVAFLRERSQGTIERLLVSPLRRTELVVGYVIGFTIFALVQSLVVLLYTIGVLRVHYHGNLALLFLVTGLLTIGGVNMGIFVSAFARNELQVIQFVPLLIAPQILLGGLFFPVKSLPIVLHQLAYLFPLTYAGFALKDIMLRGFGFGEIWPDLLFLLGFAVVMVLGSAVSLRQDRI